MGLCVSLVWGSLVWVFVAPATAQDAAALMARARAYYHGSGVPRSYAKAADFYRRAAEMGDHTAQTAYGWMLARGFEGVPKDRAAAFRWLERGAQGGAPGSLFELGAAYFEGWGVRPDKAEACRWLKRSAEAGDPRGALETGRCYQKGYGGWGVNHKKAFQWFRKGAESGHVYSMRFVGNSYAKGRGTPRDYAKALTWYRRAAEAGDHVSQDYTGYMYYRGLGVPRDYATARSWFRKSADQGNSRAMYNLAEMYEYGRGVDQDLKQALSLYQRAEDEGYSRARPKVERLRIELADFEPLPPPPEPDRRTTRRTNCGPHGTPVWNGNVQSCKCDPGYTFVGDYGGVAVNTCVEAPDLNEGLDIESIPMDDPGPNPGGTRVFGQD